MTLIYLFMFLLFIYHGSTMNHGEPHHKVHRTRSPGGTRYLDYSSQLHGPMHQIGGIPRQSYLRPLHQQADTAHPGYGSQFHARLHPSQMRPQPHHADVSNLHYGSQPHSSANIQNQPHIRGHPQQSSTRHLDYNSQLHAPLDQSAGILRQSYFRPLHQQTDTGHPGYGGQFDVPQHPSMGGLVPPQMRPPSHHADTARPGYGGQYDAPLHPSVGGLVPPQMRAPPHYAGRDTAHSGYGRLFDAPLPPSVGELVPPQMRPPSHHADTAHPGYGRQFDAPLHPSVGGLVPPQMRSLSHNADTAHPRYGSQFHARLHPSQMRPQPHHADFSNLHYGSQPHSSANIQNQPHIRGHSQQSSYGCGDQAMIMQHQHQDVSRQGYGNIWDSTQCQGASSQDIYNPLPVTNAMFRVSDPLGVAPLFDVERSPNVMQHPSAHSPAATQFGPHQNAGPNQGTKHRRYPCLELQPAPCFTHQSCCPSHKRFPPCSITTTKNIKCDELFYADLSKKSYICGDKRVYRLMKRVQDSKHVLGKLSRSLKNPKRDDMPTDCKYAFGKVLEGLANKLKHDCDSQLIPETQYQAQSCESKMFTYCVHHYTRSLRPFSGYTQCTKSEKDKIKENEIKTLMKKFAASFEEERQRMYEEIEAKILDSTKPIFHDYVTSDGKYGPVMEQAFETNVDSICAAERSDKCPSTMPAT